MKVWVLVLLLLSMGFSLVVVNSFDGRDVVSATYYGAVSGEGVVFVPPDYLENVVYGKIGENKEVTLIQSAENPIIIGMKNSLENKGNTVIQITSEDPYATNLQLAGSSRAEGFVLVDPVYGYNTVSALPYAKEKGMYLIFVNKDNMESVVEFLNGADPEEILLYGYVDGEVKALLQDNGLLFEEINNGDKFLDNIEIVEEYFKMVPDKGQVILSDGNALEDTIVAGDDPVLLISPLVSTDTYNYLKDQVSEGQVSVGLVVDKEYAQTAYDLKTSINEELGEEKLGVLVKFGQSIPSVGSGMLEVDLFPLRGPVLGLRITSADYNTASGALEVTYENTGNAPEYVRSQIIVIVDGAYAGTVGDEEPFPLGREELLGKAYPVEIENGEIIVNITAYYGASMKSTESGIRVIMGAGRVDFVDASGLAISGFNQDAATGDVFVTYENTGAGRVYFRPDATVLVNGKSTKITDDNLYELGSTEGQMVKFPGILGSAGEGEAEVVAGADYGSREAFLDKRVEESHLFEVVEPPPEEEEFDMSLLFLLIIVLLVIVIAYLVLGRKKEQAPAPMRPAPPKAAARKPGRMKRK